MSAEGTIILYDLPSQEPCRAWSLNPWKTRLLLAFKDLDYKTEWVEYPDIRPKFEEHFPLPEGVSLYTIPTVKFPDGKYIMNSKDIAQYIEEQYPEPSIHLDSPYIRKVMIEISALFDHTLGRSLYGVVLDRIPSRVLNPRSAEYWIRTRSEIVGKPLGEMTAEERGGKVLWDNAVKNMAELTRLLKENPDGPFFEGKTVTYADFYWVGFLLFFRRLGEDVFQKLISVSGDVEGSENVHLKLLEACKQWSERDDH
ncbi:hypothetical protein PFICI_13549 [Pestalotiopsis fici W106-1]|uniref:GST N-terminal domain-containing protein n=1 Tax=Pestalotiopsis fici (strain W106-1 / CGMCC3.15140) TaxID=1229662 RepID=W3WMB6_PESFW|nr:uncharacterized protein PFICI_13549 [Pestalotiopsis fici W106-1]ETS75065.1 hypothetical protein PFICI_13549 [Pestalotiopsis fici W106-1]